MFAKLAFSLFLTMGGAHTPQMYKCLFVYVEYEAPAGPAEGQ